MWIGIFMGLAACALWGLTYIVPLILHEYDPLYITLSRAVVMGAVSLCGIILQRKALKDITAKDWRFAFVLTMIGNVIQCWALMKSVEYGGAVLAGMCFGLIPVLVALIANERDRRKGKTFLPLSKLAVPLTAIAVGMVLSNWSELLNSVAQGNSPTRFFIGILFGLSSTAMWTWYPIRNADWLLEHPKVSPVFWTSVQCVILLPVGLVLYAATYMAQGGIDGVLGSRPFDYVVIMLFVGVFCSFVATALWNGMSQRVPTALVGQMLVFETVFSVIYAHLYDWRLPTPQLAAGCVLMAGGVSYALRLFEKASGSQADKKENA